MTPSPTLSLVGLLFLSLASSETVDPSVKDLANRNADFATRLYRAVSSRTDDNVFLSAFTLSAGLSALLSATSGPTQVQLLQALSLNGLDPETLPGGSGVQGLQTVSVLVLNCEVTDHLCCSQICSRI